MGKKTRKPVLIGAAAVILLAAGTGGALMYRRSMEQKRLEQERIAAEQARIQAESVRETLYLGGYEKDIVLIDRETGESFTMPRGSEVTVRHLPLEEGEETWRIVYLNEREYLAKDDQLADSTEKTVYETEGYVRLPAVLYEYEYTPEIAGYLLKGSHVNVIGISRLLYDGSVDRYLVESDGQRGYLRGSYFVLNADQVEDNVDEVHYGREDLYGGGNAYTLEYPQLETYVNENNPMPREVRCVYLNRACVDGIEYYIELAKNTGINAFVLDIKESDGTAYQSPVIEAYSPSGYKHTYSKFETYKNAVQKCKEAGIYMIGRIVTFKDDNYAADHPEYVLSHKDTGAPYRMGWAYWPSAYQREVWEYNCMLACEAVEQIGFNEIQFDYVRFPDRITNQLELIDFRNTYDETMAQAINRFLLYVRDELHDRGAYMSADVFGETSKDYVTAYGQYWPMISNIADVISAMPYPDHFNRNDYGLYPAVWTQPGNLLRAWGSEVVERQKETKNPAIVRTWIQGYDTTSRDPVVYYTVDRMNEQIDALYENGLDGGYMVWYAQSFLERYYSFADAFRPRIEE